MNRHLRLPLLVIGLVLAVYPVHAFTSFKDAFTSSTKNAKWEYQKEGGSISFSGGKATLNISRSTIGDYGAGAILFLSSPEPKVTENWETQVTVVNKSSKNVISRLGLAVCNAANPEGYNSSIELATEGGNLIVTNYYGTPSTEKNGKSKKFSATKMYLRIKYTRTNKLVTFYYRTATSAPWTRFSSFSPFNSTSAESRANWRMSSTTGRFAVAIGGTSHSKTSSGNMIFDDFLIKN